MSNATIKIRVINKKQKDAGMFDDFNKYLRLLTYVDAGPVDSHYNLQYQHAGQFLQQTRASTNIRLRRK